MDDQPIEPRRRRASEGILARKMARFESAHADTIEALTRAGHAPSVKGIWQVGEGGGARVWLSCNTCGARRRRWLPERWQPLTSERPCDQRSRH